MSPSWPEPAPNEERGASADSRSVSLLCLCLAAAAGDGSSDTLVCRIGPSGEENTCWLCRISFCSAKLKPTSKHRWLPPFHSGQHRARTPSKRCPVAASTAAKAAPANSHLSRALGDPGCHGQPRRPPRPRHQPQQPNHAGWERDGHFNDASPLLSSPGFGARREGAQHAAGRGE